MTTAIFTLDGSGGQLKPLAHKYGGKVSRGKLELQVQGSNGDVKQITAELRATGLVVGERWS